MGEGERLRNGNELEREYNLHWGKKLSSTRSRGVTPS